MSSSVPTRGLRWLGQAGLLLLVVAGLATGVGAHESEEHGSVSLHDEQGASPSNALFCEFWVEGHDVEAEEGEIRAVHIEANDRHEHHVGYWDASSQDDEGFEAGPFRLPAGWGNYTFYAVPNATGEHATERTDPVGYTECSDETKLPACPTGVTIEAREDGSLALDWKHADGADSYKIYRAHELEFGKIAAVQEPGFVDKGTEEDTTYRYRVVSANEAGESRDCSVVEATTIPFMPGGQTTGYAALAAIATLAAVHVGRRRS